MEIHEAFQTFLETKVNLNQDRITKIKNAQRVLPEFIANTEAFKNIYLNALVQGSYRQKTIIKPKGEDPSFDLDLLILLQPKAGWTPKNYLENLAKEFKDSGRYEDLTDTSGKNRCVTIDYEGDFHVDLVPAIVQGSQYFICNKNTNQFELSDGDGYAEWFQRQDIIASGNLVPAVRLIKYLRDYKNEFDTKSIILTTIAGMVIDTADWTNGLYNNIPTTLTTILTRMHEFLSHHNTPPAIANPAMPNENFNRHWKNDQEGFKKLKDAILKYAAYAQAAAASSQPDGALKAWKTLFGDEFQIEVAVSTPKSFSSSVGTTAFSPQKPWNTENA